MPGAKRFILELRERGKKVVFLSNNPTKDPEMYSEKLTRLELLTPKEETINTIVTMTQWLLDDDPPLSHGFKVGVGSIAIAALYEQVLQRNLGNLDIDALCNS